MRSQPRLHDRHGGSPGPLPEGVRHVQVRVVACRAFTVRRVSACAIAQGLVRRGQVSDGPHQEDNALACASRVKFAQGQWIVFSRISELVSRDQWIPVVDTGHCSCSRPSCSRLARVYVHARSLAAVLPVGRQLRVPTRLLLGCAYVAFVVSQNRQGRYVSAETGKDAMCQPKAGKNAMCQPRFADDCPCISRKWLSSDIALEGGACLPVTPGVFVQQPLLQATQLRCLGKALECDLAYHAVCCPHLGP